MKWIRIFFNSSSKMFSHNILHDTKLIIWGRELLKWLIWIIETWASLNLTYRNKNYVMALAWRAWGLSYSNYISTALSYCLFYLKNSTTEGNCYLCGRKWKPHCTTLYFAFFTFKPSFSITRFTTNGVIHKIQYCSYSCSYTLFHK